ncbi:MAG: hypothetical protein HYS25_03565 [Ignavibacteriales bacterium]|nr:hypothetical protein [Ignavibacteriales bacterium]
MKRWFKIISVLIIIAAGCTDNIVQTEEELITERYQANEYNMILLVTRTKSDLSAILEWDGFSTLLIGKYDKKEEQIIMTGDYFGYQNISFNMFYMEKDLHGGFNYNGQGTKAISFKFVHNLE